MFGNVDIWAINISREISSHSLYSQILLLPQVLICALGLGDSSCRSVQGILLGLLRAKEVSRNVFWVSIKDIVGELGLN
jgi:hypothetical protein